MSSTELTFWDHVTLLGALGVVVGYIVFRIRIALNPGKGGCGGCGGCGGGEGCAPPPSSSSVEFTSSGQNINLLDK